MGLATATADRPDAETSPPPLAVRPQAGRPDHLAYVDALRGWAILAVVLTHVGQRVPDAPWWLQALARSGTWGVQLFFVVSAFTLFGSLDARAGSDRRPTAAFLARRAFRIAPLFWVGLLYYAGHPEANLATYAPAGVGLPHLLATLFLVHAWYPTTFNSVVPGGWSVGVETMFYLAVPLLHRTIRSLSSAVTLAVIAGLAAVVIAPAAMAVLDDRFPPAWRALIHAFVASSPPVQFVVFCGGIVLHFALRPPRAGDPGSRPAPWVTLAAAVLIVLAQGQVTAAIAFALLAWSLAVRPFPVMVNRATTFLGRISYSGYLWHFAVLGFVAPILLPPLHRAWGPSVGAGSARLVALFVATVVVTVPVAWASYRLIERPWIAVGRWFLGITGWGPTPRSPGSVRRTSRFDTSASG